MNIIDLKIKANTALNRLDCQQNFYSFCKFMDADFFTVDRTHLKTMCDAFQQVSDGKIKKLAISTPPRAGKSYVISLWCAWDLGNHNTESIMRNSYGAELAHSFSYDVRQMIQSDKFREIFPDCEIKLDRKAVDDWSLKTSRRNAYFCAGVGGAITGKGCTRAAIIDDVIKNFEEALSEKALDGIWKWYVSTHCTRFEGNCPEIIVATRWTKKDLIGKLTDEDSEFYDPDFVKIVIPLLDENDKSYCESIISTKKCHRLREITDDFIFNAIYMQEPIEAKGLLYPTDELKRFELKDIKSKTPEAVYGYTDTADKGEDFLCSLIGKRFGNYTYITDVVFTQNSVDYTEPIVAQMCIDTKCERMRMESNSGGESFARNVYNLIREAGGTTTIQTTLNMSNKSTRSLMSVGYVKEFVYFRSDYEQGSDYDKFMRQLTTNVMLGRNKHDDAVDGITGLADFAKRFLGSTKSIEQYNKKVNNIFDDCFDKPSNELTDSYINMRIRGYN